MSQNPFLVVFYNLIPYVLGIHIHLTLLFQIEFH